MAEIAEEVDGFSERRIGPGDHLDYLGFYESGRVPGLTLRRFIIVGGASANLSLVIFDGSGTTDRIEVVLAGPGATAKVSGLYLGHGNTLATIESIQEHQAANTTSDLLFVGVSYGRGRVIFNGLIRIEPRAKDANAIEKHESLLLAQGAEVETNPKLEILADQVRATHAATVTRPRDSEIFYLATRGIAPALARQLLADGYWQKFFDRLPPKLAKRAKQGIISARKDEKFSNSQRV